MVGSEDETTRLLSYLITPIPIRFSYSFPLLPSPTYKGSASLDVVEELQKSDKVVDQQLLLLAGAATAGVKGREERRLFWKQEVAYLPVALRLRMDIGM